MITKGIVIETKGDKAYVRAEKSSACGNCDGCASKGACHTELMLSDTQRTYELEVNNSAGASVGDVVEITSSGNFVLIFAVIIFLLPIAAAVAGYLVSGLYLEGLYPILISGVSFLVVFFAGSLIINKVVSLYSHNLISKIIKESGSITAQTNAYKE